MSVVCGDEKKPRFLLTLDTEGDNLWSAPGVITTKNAAFIHRFLNLCETYNLRPTYMVDYEMTQSPEFVELGRDVLQRQAGERGMHLHAWNTPPIVSLTPDDFRLLPYLFEYDRIVMQEKITIMTNTLEEVFDHDLVSHIAGRWGLNQVYVQILVEQEYLVDCSVTPHVSWRQSEGDPRQQGGPDYSDFPGEAYFVSHDDISQAGDSPLLEVPETLFPSALRSGKVCTA